MIVLDESQAAALDMAMVEPVCIITGGPGTGKTTILQTLLERLGTINVGLCAPTGKAAKRMFEATKREAKTIHRTLGYMPGKGVDEDGKPIFGFWNSNASNPLLFDVVIVDEASMVDVELFAKLLDAINPLRTRLVLVGDANQLPSVGPGSILADLVSSDLVPVARLTQVHRSAEGSWICNNAPRILAGEELDTTPREDFSFVESESAANVPKHCGDVLDEHVEAQILVPQRTGKAGAEAINIAMQKRFNPPRPNELQWGKDPEVLRPRDRVIHTKNNYELGVFNGEVGTIVDVEAKRLLVNYYDRNAPVEYSREDANALKLAYALTIHKSQGSEWPWVVVVVHSTHTFMLTRQLVYTGITRGKKGIVIVGDAKGIERAAKSKRDTARNTALCDRIRGEL